MTLDPLLDWHRLLRTCLRLSLRALTRLGAGLEEGEDFRVRFHVLNVAPDASPERPSMNFRNARLVLRETRWAAPASGATLWLDLPESYLRPGESTSADVDFVARHAIPGMLDCAGGIASILDARVTADLDRDAFFKIWIGGPGAQPAGPTSGR